MDLKFFTNILFAIIGGVSVYYIPRFLKYIYSRSRCILVYQFDDSGNPGERRRIHHSFGKLAQDDDASNKKAWEHTNIRINEGNATCYGPYTKELAYRGKYKARFRIKAIGLKNKNETVLIIDVAYGEITKNGHSALFGLPLIEQKISGRQLSNEKYKNFDVYFEYDSQLAIEFRCLVNNPENYKSNAERILFDNVKVFRVSEII